MLNFISKRASLLLTSLFFTFCLKLNAQDAVFSQFYNASLYLNPALAGDEENTVLNVSYRSQWARVHFPYTTTQTSLIIPYYDNPHKTPLGHKGGFGVSLYNDIAGIHSNFKTTGGNLSFAYNLQLSRKGISRVTFALQTGFIQKSINTDNLQWGEQYVPYIGFNAESPADINAIGGKAYLDITSGVFWRYHAPQRKKRSLIRSAYSGLSIAHMNHPNESVLQDGINRLPLLYKYHGGLVFSLSRQSSISANVLTMFQDTENQTNVGSYFTYALPVFTNKGYSDFLFKAGGWYRFGDSFIANMELAFDKFQLGLSYDWNVSSLRYSNRGVGTFEISLGINFTRNAPPKVRY